jgi:hypothetical protein
MIEDDTIISIQHKKLIDHDSFYNKIKKNVKKQNILKRYNIKYIFDFYIIVSSSFLLLVVPQKCNNTMCSFQDQFTLIIHNPLHTNAILFNCLTLFLFCINYIIEFIREDILTDLLDVNALINDIYIEQLFSLLSVDNQKRIIYIHTAYKYTVLLLIAISLINMFVSAFIIHTRYLNVQTYTTLITYIICCCIKLNHLYSISNTKKYILYSAYVNHYVQFNYLNEN